MPTRRTLLTLVAIAALSGCSAPPAFAVGNLVDVAVVDRTQGDVLPAYRFARRQLDRRAPRRPLRGSPDQSLGRPGARRSLGRRRQRGERRDRRYRPDRVRARPVGSAEITGWRKSYAEAAAFYFTALPDSYAARTDRPENVGVIGAAVFRERVVQPAQRPYEAPPVASNRAQGAAHSEPERRAQAAGEGSFDSRLADGQAPSAAPAPARDRESSFAKSEKLGTGHGEREYSPTTQTTFERASSQPAEIVQVRYDSYANLVALGVIGRPRPYEGPQPFPGFVPDPR